MSGEKTGSVGVGIVEGAVVLTAALVGGAAVLAGKAAVGTVRGTANIIQDHNRGRRMRKGMETVTRQTDARFAELTRKAEERDRNYTLRISTLKQEQQNMLRTFTEQSKEQQRLQEEKLAALRRAQRQYVDSRCSAIEDDLRMAEKRFDSRVDTLTKEMSAQFDNERRRIDRIFAEEQHAVRQALETQRFTLQSQIDHLQSHVQISQVAANDWINLLETEVNFLGNNYRHQFFCPGQLDRIQKRLDLAHANQARGIFEVSLPQEAFIQARTLRDHLEYLEQEWETNRLLTMELLDSAIAIYEDSKTFQMSPIEIEGCSEGEPFEVDTDTWTNGQWATNRSRLQVARDAVANPSANTTLDELRQFQQEADTAMSLATVLAVKAKCAVIASWLRVNMQSKILGKLKNAGYQLIGNEWENDDFRRANHMVLQGLNGERIAVAITPLEKGDQTVNNIDLAFRDDGGNEELRRVKLQSITEALRDAYDLPPGSLDFQPKPGSGWKTNAPEERFDLAKIRGGSN